MHLQLTLVFFTLATVFAEETWTGNWFPHNPNEIPTTEKKNDTSDKWFPKNASTEGASEQNLNVKSVTKSLAKEWSGKWFPNNPDAISSTTEKNAESSNWNGKWFPKNPSENENDYKESSYERDRIMGISNSECDDGETNLHADFDPSNADHTKMYTCLEANYKPSYNLEPIETIYDVPKFYTPVHKCMNETIAYDQHIPTLGYHRPLWPMYGEYKYLPPQRWLHSLEHGAIAMLYDPCANSSEIDKLRNVVKNCLYRHIITPYKLSSERPLALVAWAASLELSSFDQTTAIDFIKRYAKMGPEKVSRNGQYKKMLTEEAKIVSDLDDNEICPDKSTVM